MKAAVFWDVFHDVSEESIVSLVNSHVAWRRISEK